MNRLKQFLRDLLTTKEAAAGPWRVEFTPSGIIKSYEPSQVTAAGRTSGGAFYEFGVWLRDLLTSKQVALLRAENERLTETNAALEYELTTLRKDNRALVNAQLKQAGIVTLPDLAEEKPEPIQRIRRLSLHQRQREYARVTDPRRNAEASESLSLKEVKHA